MINRIPDFSHDSNGSEAAGSARRRAGRVSDFSHLIDNVSGEQGTEVRASRNRRVAGAEAAESRPNTAGSEAPRRLRGAFTIQPNTIQPGHGVTVAREARVRTSAATRPGPADSPNPVEPQSTAGSRTATTQPSAVESNASPPQAAALTTDNAGFVRSSDPRSPRLLRFSQVPAEAKHPAGPYRQAPAELGGEWWYVSPFTGPEPWVALTVETAEGASASEELPEGFERVFGARPSASDFNSRMDFHSANLRWEQDLASFQQTGLPEGYSEEQLQVARQQFEEWGLGEPVFYEAGHGWKVRFPDSTMPTFESSASAAFLAPHLVIALHQARSIQVGTTPGEMHPWLPDKLRSA